MKVLLINGQNHHGSTYHIGKELAEKIGGETKEFFLPKDFGEFCRGCTGCFVKGEEHCPHHEKLKPIVEAIDEADVVILTSPVYVMHATGSMKAFLDHLGYRWMVHRPEKKMFKKQGVCISTAAGAGMKSTNKDMADSLFNWGIPKIYKYGMAVAATGWEEVSEKKLAKIHKDMNRLAADIKNNHGKVKPGMKLKGWFMICRMIQKNGYNPLDMDYWKQKGWTEGNRPWKD